MGVELISWLSARHQVREDLAEGCCALYVAVGRAAAALSPDGVVRRVDALVALLRPRLRTVVALSGPEPMARIAARRRAKEVDADAPPALLLAWVGAGGVSGAGSCARELWDARVPGEAAHKICDDLVRRRDGLHVAVLCALGDEDPDDLLVRAALLPAGPDVRVLVALPLFVDDGCSVELLDPRRCAGGAAKGSEVPIPGRGSDLPSPTAKDLPLPTAKDWAVLCALAGVGGAVVPGLPGAGLGDVAGLQQQLRLVGLADGRERGAPRAHALGGLDLRALGRLLAALAPSEDARCARAAVLELDAGWAPAPPSPWGHTGPTGAQAVLSVRPGATGWRARYRRVALLVTTPDELYALCVAWLAGVAWGLRRALRDPDLCPVWAYPCTHAPLASDLARLLDGEAPAGISAVEAGVEAVLTRSTETPEGRRERAELLRRYAAADAAAPPALPNGALPPRPAPLAYLVGRSADAPDPVRTPPVWLTAT